MRLAKFIISGLFSVVAIACAGAQQQVGKIPPAPGDPPPNLIDPNATAVDAGFRLDAKQLKELLAKANRGDADAAFRLSLHYMTIGKSNQTTYWSLMASARGQLSAQYNRWFELKDKSDCRSKVEALAWLKSSAISGDKLAISKLKDFEDSVQSCFEN